MNQDALIGSDIHRLIGAQVKTGITLVRILWKLDRRIKPLDGNIDTCHVLPQLIQFFNELVTSLKSRYTDAKRCRQPIELLKALENHIPISCELTAVSVRPRSSYSISSIRPFSEERSISRLDVARIRPTRSLLRSKRLRRTVALDDLDRISHRSNVVNRYPQFRHSLRRLMAFVASCVREVHDTRIVTAALWASHATPFVAPYM